MGCGRHIEIDGRVVVVGRRRHPALRHAQVAAADEVAVPVPVVVAAERVVQDDDPLAAFGERLQIGAGVGAQPLLHQVVHRHDVVARTQITAVGCFRSRLVIPDEFGLFEQGIERRGIAVSPVTTSTRSGCSVTSSRAIQTRESDFALFQSTDGLNSRSLPALAQSFTSGTGGPGSGVVYCPLQSW